MGFPFYQRRGSHAPGDLFPSGKSERALLHCALPYTGHPSGFCFPRAWAVQILASRCLLRGSRTPNLWGARNGGVAPLAHPPAPYRRRMRVVLDRFLPAGVGRNLVIRPAIPQNDKRIRREVYDAVRRAAYCISHTLRPCDLRTTTFTFVDNCSLSIAIEAAQ